MPGIEQWWREMPVVTKVCPCLFHAILLQFWYRVQRNNAGVTVTVATDVSQYGLAGMFFFTVAPHIGIFSPWSLVLSWEAIIKEFQVRFLQSFIP
jgi:hypothetical protein